MAPDLGADSAADDELLLAACLVRDPDLAAGHTGLITSGADQFSDPNIGAVFDRLREIRTSHPALNGIGLRYNLDPALHPHLDRALARWDRELNQSHPLVPICGEEVDMLAATIARAWRHRRIDTLTTDMQHAYRSGDHDQAGHLAVELRDLVRTRDDPADAGDPYAEHTAEVLRTELAASDTGRGFPIHPALDVLLHQRHDWAGELILLGAKTKVGKTRLAGWWITRLLAGAAQTAAEAQVVVFCTELTRAELITLLQGYHPSDPGQVFVPTPLGRPRLLLFGKEFFARIGSDPTARLRAVLSELRRFAVANQAWAAEHQLPVADCWFAGCVIDYLTSMLAAGTDFSVCEEFVRGADTCLRVFDPGWFGLDITRCAELAGLRCNVIVCEQVNARREPPPRATRTGDDHKPPLDPPAPTEINGARSTFEVASVYCMLARDHEGRIHPPEHVVLRISGRSVVTRELTLRFTKGIFTLPGEPVEVVVDEPVDEVESLRQRIWALPCYVLAPPATTTATGALVPSQDRWVPVDPAVEGWQPGHLLS